MIEACLDAFEQVAERYYGAGDEIVAWCRLERAKFFPGAGVVLDPLLSTQLSRTKVADVIEKSIPVLKKDFHLTEIGISWVLRELPALIKLIRHT